MPKYQVLLSTVTSITIDVEADDPEAAIEAAIDQGTDGLCHQCAGYRRDFSRDEGDELEPDAVYLADDDGQEEVWASDENWRRVHTEPATK
jgi:hypothetical protein